MTVDTWPSADDLDQLPTIEVGQFHDLKLLASCTEFQKVKVWHSRLAATDGELWDDTIYVEALTLDGRWIDLGHYDGRNPVQTVGHYRPHDLGIWL
jgi:hypothetical protein